MELKPSNQSDRQKICEIVVMKKTPQRKPKRSKKQAAKKTGKKPTTSQIMSALILIAYDLWQLSKISDGKLSEARILNVCKEFKVSPKIVIKILERKGVEIVLVN